MSFSDQLKARKQRQVTSFVDLGANRVASELSTASSAIAITGSDAGGSKSTFRDNDKENVYPELSGFLEIRIDDVSGRGIWTKSTTNGGLKNIPAGSKLLAIEPHVSALSTIYLANLCSACHRSRGPAHTSLQRCVKCKKCQTHDWPAHKHECASLQYWIVASTSTVDSPETQSEDAGQGKEMGSSAKELDLMQTHRPSLQESNHRSMTMLAHALARYVTASDTPSPEALAKLEIGSARELLDIISRFTVNTFTLTNPSLTAIGVAVSPLAALVNHSCIPNAVVVFPRSSAVFAAGSDPLEVVAIRDLAPGEEILTSYVDVSLPRRLRGKELLDRYHFDCGCRSCAIAPGVGHVDAREAMICDREGCTGMLALPDHGRSVLPTCPSCQNSPSVDIASVLDAVRLGEDALEKATAMELEDPEGAMRYTSNLIPLLSRHIPMTSHPLLALYRLHQTLLIGQLSQEVQISGNLHTGSPAQSSVEASALNPRLPKERVDQVCTIAARSLSAILVVFPDGHPVRGVALAELGKLLCVDVDEDAKGMEDLQNNAGPSTMIRDGFPAGAERLKLSRDALLRARTELRRGFGGEGGEVAREVEESIRNIEKEWKGWQRVISQNTR
ncbi:hypothetical protein FRB96_000336 [Tulasnella sp. 330]|nr:hypothetical protein FRB96_000336 [Tulasnella sp. 330]